MNEHRIDEIKAQVSNSHLREAVYECIDEGKKVANDIYISSLEKVHLNEQDVAKYKKELATKVQENPIKSVLIAGGIGFLLARIFKK